MCQLFRRPPSNSRKCPQWTTEKQIQVVKARDNLSYFEDKQRCSISKQTYTSALKTTVSQGTQTAISSKNSELPTHEFSKLSFRSVASGSISKSRPPASHSHIKFQSFITSTRYMPHPY
ncbi:hypothetical protein CEXT_543211 [Caerostris extrusa]|uniref:Uncharacterized protein n=1 Tax=Caerostris extrusa TaxID=172846 RepID=A0AAV4PXJ4_CAEEX|nr:hypothetical protein CEXT_543211 [Caerostris extrusa]